MNSPNCKRYIICHMDGNSPVMTDDSSLALNYSDDFAVWVVDTLTGTYIIEGEKTPMKEVTE